MIERWESFHQGGRKAGAILRRFDDGILTSRIAFPHDDADLYRAESVITFEADGASWASASYLQEPGAVAATVTRKAAALGADTLPSFGEFMLILDLLASDAESVEFQRLDDADPTAPPARAVLAWNGTEKIGLSDGLRECRRLDLLMDGERASTHWTDEAGVVKSDWNGPESYLETTAEEALSGLPAQIGEFLEEGFFFAG